METDIFLQAIYFTQIFDERNDNAAKVCGMIAFLKMIQSDILEMSAKRMKPATPPLFS